MRDSATSDSAQTTILQADSNELRQAAYRFRYRIYVQTMGRPQHWADHSNQTVVEPLDEMGVTYVALRGDAVVGTVRRNFFDDPALTPYAALYDVKRFSPLKPGNIAVTTKLMVSPELQGTTLPVRLLQHFAREGVISGVVVDLIDCNSHLVGLFERFGYLSYMGWQIHKEYGNVMPMFFPVDSVAYQEAIKSPLLSCTKCHVEDGAFGGYDLIHQLSTQPTSERLAEIWRGFKAQQEMARVR